MGKRKEGADMQDLSVAAVQMTTACGDIEGSIERHRAWVQRAAKAGAQLVCFPECSVTGYESGLASALPLEKDDQRLLGLEEFARECGVCVGYGFIEEIPNQSRLCISYVISCPDGRMMYRKTHLGTRERCVFSAGEELPVVNVDGVVTGVQLCWEAHLPEVTGTLRAKGAQLVVMPHASGLELGRRLELWGRYLPARAYDNGLHVIACNARFAQEDGSVRGGGVVAYGPDGGLRAQCADECDSMLVVQVGGPLPRETADVGMRSISYFDRRRPELYS